MPLTVVCGRCGGSGKPSESSLLPSCPACKGSGRKVLKKRWNVVNRNDELLSEHDTEDAAKRAFTKLASGMSRLKAHYLFSIVENEE